MTPTPDRGRQPEPGRLVRGGRSLARVLLVWLTATVTLWVLDDALSGFAMEHWWLAPVCALLLGLLAAVVWPLVMRVALPVAVYTFGLGGLVLLAVAVVAVFSVVPGVTLAGPVEALAVVLGTAVATVLVSALLAIDTDEIFFRRTGRRARRHVAGGASPSPGVLFLQVDGLGLPTLRRAVRDGTMPTLARWLADGSHHLAGWHTDWSAQTGASQCGILHGDNDDVVGFRWYEKDRRRVVTCSSPGDAAEIERRHSDGHGLLSQDGAGRGNLFTGDAAHVSLTLSAVPLLTRARGGRVRRDRIGAGYYAYFANPVNAVRTFVAALADVVRELVDAARQRRADVRPRIRRGGLYPLARAGTTVVARDVLVSALIEDMLAGRPVAYADFVGYDEVAHHSGIERADALHVLRTIDQQIGRLARAAELAPRPYELVVLSDHGQTQGQAFTDRFGESVEHLVGRLCGEPGDDPAGEEPPEPVRAPRSADGWQLGATLAEAGSGVGPVARLLTARRTHADRVAARTAPERPASRAAPDVLVLASGHTALVSFTAVEGRASLERVERRYPDLLPGLVDHPGVGFLLVRGEHDGPMVLGRDGTHRLSDGVVTGEDPLEPYGPHAAALVARMDGFTHCADLMVNSRYDPVREDASPFEPHVGSHGGLGGPQNDAFVLYPAGWSGPETEIVGAEALHRVLRGWLTDLGHLNAVEAGEARTSG